MLYSLKLALAILITVPASLLTILLGCVDRHGKRAYGVSRCWTWLILKICAVALDVRGRSHLDPNRPYIFMANHQSNIDIPILVQSLPGFQLRWIAKQELLRVPLFGRALRAAKHITVDRGMGAGALASFNEARERIANGVSVVVFPEGTRSENGEVLPFKRGGLLLAAKTRAPVVPVAIAGSGALLPKGDWRVKGGKVRVTIGRPVPAEKYRAGDLGARADEMREWMQAQIARSPEERTAAAGHPAAAKETARRRDL